MAGTIDNALDLYGNALRGTASQRAAFLSTAVDGMLWQDTDGIRMIWRKDGALWVPAVMRWRGTTAQMNSFGANAPDGFEWFSTSDSMAFIRSGATWRGTKVQVGTVALPQVPAQGVSGPFTVTFPIPYSEIPSVSVTSDSVYGNPVRTTPTVSGTTVTVSNPFGVTGPTGRRVWWEASGVIVK